MLTYADVCLRMLMYAGVEYHHATCQTEVPPKPKAVSEDTAPPKFHRETQTKKVSSPPSWPSKPARQCAQHIRFTAAFLPKFHRETQTKKVSSSKKLCRPPDVAQQARAPMRVTAPAAATRGCV
jgi:hypothetical protein